MSDAGARRRGGGRAAAGPRRRVPDGSALDSSDYLADVGLATALFLAVRLPQPILLEGEAGVGQDRGGEGAGRAARHARCTGCSATRESTPVRPSTNGTTNGSCSASGWPKSATPTVTETDLFGPEYLLRRPLLQAIEHPGPRPAVLLLDEIDRADAEFEAFTFELLAEAAVTIPELGTIRATHPPIVILTSNRTRDLHDALTRRCLYHWIDYPGRNGSRRSCAAGFPPAAARWPSQAAAVITKLRTPGPRQAAGHLRGHRLGVGAGRAGGRPASTPGIDRETWGSIVKNRDDLELVGARGAAWLVDGTGG